MAAKTSDDIPARLRDWFERDASLRVYDAYTYDKELHVHSRHACDEVLEHLWRYVVARVYIRHGRIAYFNARYRFENTVRDLMESQLVNWAQSLIDAPENVLPQNVAADGTKIQAAYAEWLSHGDHD